MQKHLLLILVAFCFVSDLRAGDHPIGSLSGTYLVGSSQTYKNLTDVAAVLNNAGYTVTGNVVFELDSDYDGATETLPIVFNQFNTSGSWTVTIRPKAGVSMRTTSGNPGIQSLITFNGTDRIILDGRAGGTGGIAWLIRNTATINAEAAIRLQNDAQNNTFTYLQLEGQTDWAGVVYIANPGAQGNDNNTISYCAIRDRTDVSTPARPVNGILSYGSETTTGNKFDHNAIFNFYNSGGSAYGIQLVQGTTDALITHNSIYQEQPLLNAPGGTALYGISAAEWTTNRLTIANNFIGGSAPQCGGAPLTIASAANSACAVTGIFYGMRAAPFGDQNICNQNTIRNIDITVRDQFNAFPGIFAGIYTIAKMDVKNNTIGNPDGHDDIKITAGGGTEYVRTNMIAFMANYPGIIAGNRIGGITLAGKTTKACDVAGIYGFPEGGSVSTEPFVISENSIGSMTMPDNIRVAGDTLPVNFLGINFTMDLSLSCINNTVAGVAMGYAGKTIQTSAAGIRVSCSSTLLVKNNQVSGISSASLTPFTPPEFAGSGTPHELTGIYALQRGGLMEVSGNMVSGLRLTGTGPISPVAGTSKTVHGIHLVTATATSPTRVYNNKVYGLSSANDLGASSATVLSGIYIEEIANSVVMAYNNLVSLDNGGLSNNCQITGFRVNSTIWSYANNLYHNAIYIGGSSSASSNTAFSALITYSLGNRASTNFSIRNNLLVNGRTGGSGPHYIFHTTLEYYQDANWTTATSDTNVLVTANMNTVGRRASSDLDSTQWKEKSDPHSWFYATSQISPAALFTNAAAGDLSIKPGARRYVIWKGASSAGIATDYAGEIRSTTAPTIGAYEYLSLPIQNEAPVITSHGGNAAVTLPVPENTTVVTTATATDADAGTLTYSLAGGEDAAKFTVNSSTGELSFITAPDFEQPGDANGDNTYIVTVQVSDGDLTATQRFKIKVTDANDHAPVITSYTGSAAVTLQVPENTTTVIATVTATDSDKNTTITYSLVNEEDAAQFGVNPSTGELSFVTPPPNFEQPRDINGDNVYIVTVKASDGDSSATQRFKIRLTNVNDNAPAITSYNGDALVTLQLPENTIQVSTVTATDGDSTALTYSVLGEKDGILFAVNPSTGELSFITAPDFEHPADANGDNTYLVSVQASDGSLSAVQRFSIKITDLADNPPVVTMTIRIPENTLEVTPLEGTDDDAGTSVTFTMMDKEDGALFRINPANGSLEFRAAPDLENPADADHDNIYLVSVKMTAADNITILRFQVKVTASDAGTGRTTGRSTPEPQVQSTVALQAETAPEPGKSISVYPNPVTGKRFSLRMDSVAAGRYALELYSAAGQLVCRQQLNHTGKSVLYPVQLPGSLTRGAYMLKLTGIDLRHTEKLVVE
ncbi:MAG: cadherin domain-containing protein [Chitinophagaceae bacterium]